ncbi:methylated-DNA--protein-cysteine methyltransferase [Plodia interpunctella]|uniref:methylated-DNA--protein-cysteine methyltransferase n=1 Tax=Plodia interpunctella TaxID=58824 RepID=UPI002367EF92|nr:methylated-DNA--protein-cysteine methyltransferase [Plodia interpunctella]
MNLSSILDKYSKDSDKIVYMRVYDTPVGNLIAAGDEKYLYMLVSIDSKNFEKHFKVVSEQLTCHFVEGSTKVLDTLNDEITAYFDGKLKIFSVPMQTFGSDFQKQVWKKLQELPFGITQTYGDLAKSLGMDSSHSRAVGAACGANAHLIVIPCHRVIASGSKGGFSSGVDRKEKLLDHEKKYCT